MAGFATPFIARDTQAKRPKSDPTCAAMSSSASSGRPESRARGAGVFAGAAGEHSTLWQQLQSGGPGEAFGVDLHGDLAGVAGDGGAESQQGSKRYGTEVERRTPMQIRTKGRHTAPYSNDRFFWTLILWWL